MGFLFNRILYSWHTQALVSFPGISCGFWVGGCFCLVIFNVRIADLLSLIILVYTLVAYCFPSRPLALDGTHGWSSPQRVGSRGT